MGFVSNIFILPEDDRYEAAEAYSDLLSPTQIETIHNAPATAIIQIQVDGKRAQVNVIEEG